MNTGVQSRQVRILWAYTPRKIPSQSEFVASLFNIFTKFICQAAFNQSTQVHISVYAISTRLSHWCIAWEEVCVGPRISFCPRSAPWWVKSSIRLTVLLSVRSTGQTDRQTDTRLFSIDASFRKTCRRLFPHIRFTLLAVWCWFKLFNAVKPSLK